MARRGDIGPYAVGNVYITTNTENSRDGIRKAHQTLRQKQLNERIAKLARAA
jgi:hypothetical protein